MPKLYVSAGLTFLKGKPYNKLTKETKSSVTIIVADGLGRPVDILVDKLQKAGSYSVEFKGKGYYFVYYITTLINGKVVSSKKLIHVNR